MIPSPPEHALAWVALWLLAVAAVLTVGMAAAVLAVHLADVRRQRRRAQRFARWTPPLLAMIGGEIDPETFLSGVRPRERGDALRLLTSYAIRLRGPGYRRLCAAAAPLLPIATRAMDSGRPEVRARGVFTLGLLGRDETFPVVAEALKDDSPMVAFAAARALSRMGAPRGLSAVVAALGRFGHVHPDAVAAMLARFGLRAGHPMMRALADPKRPATERVALVGALRRLSYVPAADLAVQLLIAGEDDPPLAAALLALLFDIGDPHHAAAVRRYADAEDETVRIQALSTLARLSGEEKDAWRLAYALDHPNPWLAMRAASGLREMGFGDLVHEQAGTEGPLRGLATLSLHE